MGFFKLEKKVLKKITKKKPSARAWAIFILSACFLFYKYILQISPSVMTTELMQTYALSGTMLGFMVGFYFYTYMIMQIPSGILLDRYGPHRVTGMAILICALGILIFSQTNHFALACFARMLIGFGAAFATTSYMKLASDWFPVRYFPLFSGLFGTACMSGAGTAQVPLAWLVNHSSWRQALLLCAILGFILCFLFFVIVKDKKRPQHNDAAPVETFQWRGLIKIFKNFYNWPLLLYGGLMFTPIAVFGGLWGNPFLAASYGFSKAAAASSVSLVFFGFALGGIAIGFMGKHFKRHLPILVVGTVAALIFISIVLYVPHLPLSLLNTCIFLFGCSASSSLLCYAIAKNINSAALVGTLMGAINMGDPLCGAVADPLIGKILDLHWDGNTMNNVRVFSVHAYQLGLSVLTVYLVLALICCAFIKENK